MEAPDVVKNILEHHGVLGMKWGVRKAGGPARVTVTDKRKRIATRGGQGYPANKSAVQARIIGQKAKKSGVKSLSDEELRTYANRIQAEQNVKRLQYNEKPAAERFVLRILGKSGEQSATTAANTATKAAGKKALAMALA